MADDQLAAALAKKREVLAAAWAVLDRTPPRTLAPSLGIAAGIASVALDALEAALKLADELAGPDDSAEPSALTEDRAWVRQECAERLRGAIAGALPGTEADGG